MAAEDEFEIDLTLSENEEVNLHGGKRSRAKAAPQEDEPSQRRRIMEFAASSRATAAAAHPPLDSKPSPQQRQQERGGLDLPQPNGPGLTDDAARRRIMSYAAGVWAQARPSPSNEDPGISNEDLGRWHAERIARRGLPPGAAPAERPSAPTGAAPAAATLSVLSYNVWFREDVALRARIRAVCQIIVDRDPDVIALQEVTPNILSLLRDSPWWQRYTCAPAALQAAAYFTLLLWRTGAGSASGGVAALPFENSVMGRDLKAGVVQSAGLRLRVATSHLESPTGWDKLYSAPRQAQCAHALEVLHRSMEDVVFIGDMNWAEKNDGPVPLPPGWVDAWAALHPGEPGYTYDAGSNPMLQRKKGGGLRLRLDRALCRLRAWRLQSLEMVGTQAIPGEIFDEKPVLPSDHYGLLLRLAAAG